MFQCYKKIYMRKFILILLVILGLNFNFLTLHSQEVFTIKNCCIRKITLYVIPPSYMFRIQVNYYEVKKISDIKLSIKSPSELDDYNFLQLLHNLNENDKVEIIQDYRIKCIIRKSLGREVLYFNGFGGFLYKGHTFYNEDIKNLIWKYYLPLNF